MSIPLPSFDNAQPAAEAPSTKGNYITDSKAFRLSTTTMQRQLRDLMTLAESVYSLGKGGKFSFPNGTAVGRKELNTLVAELAASIETRGKEFTASVTKSRAKKAKTTADGTPSKKGEQLLSLFYVSDQLVEYFTNANYGNGLAYICAGKGPHFYRHNCALEKYRNELISTFGGEGIIQALQNKENADAALARREPVLIGEEAYNMMDVTTSLGLIIRSRMATSGILVSLLALISSVGQLQSLTHGNRNHYDANMVAHFDGKTNTRYMINGQDFTPSSVPDSVKEKDRAAFQKKIDDSYLSSFERLRRREDSTIKRASSPTGEVVVPCFIEYNEEIHKDGNDDWGLLHAMYMVLTSHFRIPNVCLPQQFLARTASIKVQALDAEGQPIFYDEARKNPVLVETNENIIAAVQVQDYIKLLLDAQRELNKDKKKKDSTARRLASAAKPAAAAAAPAPRRQSQLAGSVVLELPKLA